MSEQWKYDEIGAEHGCPQIIDETGGLIAQLRGWGRLTGTGGMNLPPHEAAKVQDARGRLMAAAPDLLAACKEAERHHQGYHSEVGKMLRAAIAKAEGR